jgi:hypothetical protein
MDMGVPQALEAEGYHVVETDTSKRIEQARQYMESVDISQDLKDLCRNKHELCSICSVQGECQSNPQCKFVEWHSVNGNSRAIYFL